MENTKPMLDAENGVMAKYTDNVRFMAQAGGDNSGAIEVLGTDGGWKRVGEWRFDGNTKTLKTPLDKGVTLIPELQSQKDKSTATFRDYLAAREAAPVPPEEKPEAQAAAEKLRAEGVRVTGLDGGIPENGAPSPDPAAPQVSPAARQQHAESQDAAEARADFVARKAERIRLAVAALKAQDVIYDESYVAALPSVRDAADEVALEVALNAATAKMLKQHADMTVLGGDKGEFRMAGGKPLKPKPAQDQWKCPNCGTINGMQFLNDEGQPFEVCGSCTVTIRRDLAYNLYRVVKDGKTAEEMMAEQNNTEAK